MKKVLFATTALVATAGMASADITLSGGGRIGIYHQGATTAYRITPVLAGHAAAVTAVGVATTANVGALGTLTTARAALVTAQGVYNATVTAGTTTAADAATLLAAGVTAAAAETAYTVDGTTVTLVDSVTARDALAGTTGTAVAGFTRYEKRMTINIDGSGETDGGLSFGGRIRLRSDEGRSNTRVAQGNIFIGNDTWRVTIGNTDGALVNRLGYFRGSVGLTGLGYRNVSFNIGNASWGLNSYSSGGNGGQVVRLDFNAGDFGVSLSTGGGGTNLSTTDQDAIAVSYNFGDWKVAAGYANDNTNGDISSVSIAGSFGDFGVGLGYSDRQNVGSKIVLSGSYSFGSTNVTAFVANTSEDTVGSAGIGISGSDTEYGLGFTHSLGGATLAGGITRDYTSTTRADLGIRFNF